MIMLLICISSTPIVNIFWLNAECKHDYFGVLCWYKCMPSCLLYDINSLQCSSLKLSKHSLGCFILQGYTEVGRSANYTIQHVAAILSCMAECMPRASGRTHD